jgi:phospholipase C
MMKRREALKAMGGLAGAASVATLLPACGGDDPDRPVGITTYVFLMLENRSYDHYFGARSLLEGLPGDGLTAGMTNPDLGGNPVAPFPPDSELSECVVDPPHTWASSHAQWNNGANDGFVREYQTDHATTAAAPMQYLTRTELPISWELADAYTSCDRWFASLMGPTFPNRAYWHLGTSLGLDNNDAVMNALTAGVTQPTMFHRLVEAGVDWAFYYGSYAIAALLATPGPFQLDIGPSDGTGNVRRFGDAESRVGQFFDDAAAGTLPPVVYIDPAFDYNDDHAPAHPILAQSLIAAVYTALARSPQWNNVLLVITYDEHGGFFDHVSPPQTADDTLAKFGVDGFQQLGFRVPTMVVGPYVKQGYVSSVQYDHTSVLKHLQTTFGLAPLTARIDAANDLLDCIDLERLAAGTPAPPIALPEIDIEEWPYRDASCSESGVRRGPLHAWLDANPGGFDPAYDARRR